MAINLSPNMSLPVPGVGTEAGPQYATDVNSCLTILDGHDHTPGSGVLITPAAINVNADLLMNDENLTTARSVRFTSQPSPIALPTDLGALYESGVDLYYNDGLGNQIRITQSGGIAGTPGSISNLTPPASASYVAGNQTFVFQSAALTPANLDAASIILRNLTPSSFGLTLSPPTLASDYSITLPQLPAQTNVVIMTSSGIMSSVTYDAVGTSMTSTGANAIANSRTRATGTTVGLGGVAVSASSGTQLITAGTPAQITNFSLTITTAGRPVVIQAIDDGSLNQSDISMGTGGTLEIKIFRGVTQLTRTQVDEGIWEPSVINFLDFPAPGTYTYTITLNPLIQDVNVKFIKMIVYEI